MKYIFLCTVADGADFNSKLRSAAFLTEHQARAWGEAMRDAYRAMRKAEGETDQVFIDAIDYAYIRVEYLPEYPAPQP